jgi:hypothetical protein
MQVYRETKKHSKSLMERIREEGETNRSRRMRKRVKEVGGRKEKGLFGVRE